MYRIVFAGSPDFCLETLEQLYLNHNVVGVLTQPDKPKGRGKKILKVPVKKWCEDKSIKVFQPEKIDQNAVEEISKLEPDFLVVYAYGLLLPQSLLDVPRLSSLNIHPSSLPRWRGAAPIQHTVLNGDLETSVCVMKMVKALDAGPIYLQKRLEISPTEGTAALTQKLSNIGARILLDVISLWPIEPVEQQGDVTYAHKINTHDAIIDWTKSSQEVTRSILAYDMMPVARTLWNGQWIKIGAAQIGPDVQTGLPGKVISSGKGYVRVQCGKGSCDILSAQIPGKKMMPISVLRNGTPQIDSAEFSS